MTTAEKRLLDLIRRRAGGMVHGLTERELAAFELIRQSLTERELVAALRSGTVEDTINRLLSDDALDGPFARLRAHIDAVTLRAGAVAADQLPSRFRTVFDYLSPTVRRAVLQLDVRAIRSLKDDVRETVRQRALAGIEAGENPRVTAKAMRRVIGLSPRQEQAVRNFVSELERGDRKALQRALAKGQLRTEAAGTIRRTGHAANQGLTSRQLGVLMRDLGTRQLSASEINTMAEAYRKRLMAWNAESNARTIALNSQKLAQRLAWENAAEQGIVERGQLRKTWVAVGGPAGDGRNRPEHLELHGAEIGFDQSYPNGEFVPGDSTYNCRCIERVTVKRDTGAAAA